MQVDAHVDTLTSEQASFALKRAGFTLVYDRLQNFDPQQRVPLSQYPNMDAQSLAAVMVIRFVCVCVFVPLLEVRDACLMS